MMLVSFITASVICFTGTIGFIGLVSPHIARMVIGGDHRFLLPASALMGALLLLGADTVARTILAPVILPVGIMTAFLGVPFFVYLFLKRKRSSGEGESLDLNHWIMRQMIYTKDITLVTPARV